MSKQLKVYGLTTTEYAEMVSRANNACEICRDPGLPIAIDHDHSTGRARGPLCIGCNNRLSFVDRGLREPTDDEAIYLAWQWTDRGRYGNTLPVNFRVPDDVRKSARRRAAADGVPLTSILVEVLREWAENGTLLGEPFPG